MAASTVMPGDVSIRCGAKMLGEPSDNVWSYGCNIMDAVSGPYERYYRECT